jgi:hypothetical protein
MHILHRIDFPTNLGGPLMNLGLTTGTNERGLDFATSNRPGASATDDYRCPADGAVRGQLD